MPANIKFATSFDDGVIIAEIVSRAVKLGLSDDRTSTHMDLAACHLNGTPIRLADLLDADDFNFIHDVGGITRHMNREAGRLGDHFSPRFSARFEKAA